MNIILEGPDGGRKTTLAASIHTITRMPIIPGEGPPKAPGEINERARRYLQLDWVIFDRHPCVSQPIYRMIRAKDNEAIDAELLDQFYRQNNLIIYCQPNELSLQNMTVAEHEDPDHIAAVRARYGELRFRYDGWAVDHAHHIFRPGQEELIHTLAHGIHREITRQKAEAYQHRTVNA